jgi:hypothetical protein
MFPDSTPDNSRGRYQPLLRRGKPRTRARIVRKNMKKNVLQKSKLTTENHTNPETFAGNSNEMISKRSGGWLKNGSRPGDPHSAPRCGAKTRRGSACQAPAMANGRCRLHGGKSTGPRTVEGLERCRRANWKHGFYSKKATNRRLIIF